MDYLGYIEPILLGREKAYSSCFRDPSIRAWSLAIQTKVQSLA